MTATNTICRIAVLCTLLLLGSKAYAASDTLARQVLDEINLARTAPQNYAGQIKEFRRQFRGKHYLLPSSTTRVVTTEGVTAVDEAIQALSRQKPRSPLSWSDGLAAAAHELVTEQGKTGATGHNGKESGGMRERIERHGKWERQIGENIGYGPDEARMMVMQLIIDDGVHNRGHRKTIYNATFATAGAACGPHPQFRTLCVIDFAGGFHE